ncbi:MAG: methyltransferase [Thermodesulfobacteriota bacterium]
MEGPWNPKRVMEAARAFQVSRLILTAAELDLFTMLQEVPRSSAQVSDATGLDKRALDVILHALVALELLEERDGGFVTPRGLFTILSSRSEESIIPALRHLASLWRRWGDLTGVVRRGSPETVSSWEERPAPEREAFIRAMHVMGRELAPQVISCIALEGVRRVLDVGGASGTYAIEFLRASSDLSVTLFDLPSVIPMAKERLTQCGLSGRVELVAGDFERDPLPPGHDMAFLSAVIHQNDRDQNRALFRKVRDALVPGGRIVIRDHVMESSRNAPVAGALFAVNMLVSTKGGSTYTFEEIREDLELSGFQDAQWTRKDEWMGSLVVAVRT